MFGHDHIKRKKYSSGSSSNTTVTDYESHTDQSSITANQKENRATFNVHANQTRSRNLSKIYLVKGKYQRTRVSRLQSASLKLMVEQYPPFGRKV